MGQEESRQQEPERRAETRQAAQRYYSVQFTTPGLDSYYQFKLWNLSQKGLCILVKENSKVLGHLSVGNILEMAFYLMDGLGESEKLNAQIKHITNSPEGRFQGHYLVGLEIV